MKTLAERHADRARRKIENAALSDQVTSGSDRVGGILAHVTSAQAAIEGLSPDEQAELRARLENGGEPTEGYQDTPTFPMAGIGVLNPFVVPVGEQANGGSGDGAGVSGADALSAAVAAASWGTGAPADTAPPPAETPADETVGEDGKPLTIAKLQELLKSREVTYESDANLARLQELVRANPAKTEG